MKQTVAKKSLGQNFLVDRQIIDRIVSTIRLDPDDTVVEIGPGRGALTERLVASGARVLAIELDRLLVPQLRDNFLLHSNFSIFEGDALETDFRNLLANGPTNANRAKLVANLPYYISTAILQRLSEQRECFSSLVLMFQREVVERISAKPGDSERGYLTILVEAAFSIERLFDVPPSAFDPQPKVWSSVVRLTPTTTVIEHELRFRALVSTAFGQKRKTILNNLKNEYPGALSELESSGIDPRRRAETLTLAEWIDLHNRLCRK